MQFDDFVASLKHDACPDHLEPCLQALWHDARGDWDAAHEIVQTIDSTTAARVHAYLHRKEGDQWNSRYWHRRAGSKFPDGVTLETEWELLARELTE